MLTIFYQIICSSIPLLDFAIERSDGELKEYYEKHRKEEIGHEEILKADMDRANITPKYHLDVHLLIGYQYYWIEKSPSALLGYMNVLESNPVTDDSIQFFEQITGTKMECMRLHQQLDDGHSDYIRRMISSRSEEERLMIKENENFVYQWFKMVGNDYAAAR